MWLKNGWRDKNEVSKINSKFVCLRNIVVLRKLIIRDTNLFKDSEMLMVLYDSLSVTVPVTNYLISQSSESRETLVWYNLEWTALPE